MLQSWTFMYLQLATSEMCVGLEEGEILTELSLSYSIVYHYNGEQQYKQFWQVGRLDRTLITFGLALQLPLCLQSSHCYIYLIFFVKFFAIHFSELNMVGLTVVLQFYDTVGWVVWLVKSPPRWALMCQAGHWTLLYHTIPAVLVRWMLFTFTGIFCMYFIHLFAGISWWTGWLRWRV